MRRITVLLTSVVLLSWAGMVSAIQVPGPLVETGWLAKHRDAVVILDVRQDTKSFTLDPVFRTDKKTNRKELVRVGGHIPGAALVNYKDLRSERKINGQLVTRIVPLKAEFEKLMQQSGVNSDSAIVIVSQGEGTSDLTMATRLYWTLKYFGHDNMAILDGGMAQWIIDGNRPETRATRITAGNWQAGETRDAILASTEDVEAAIAGGSIQLVDYRSVSQYLGVDKTSYVYEKGHIPGAKMFPNELMNTGGMAARFLPKDDLEKLFSAMSIKPDADTITYCNSGHLASGGWFIMSELLGNKDVRLYDGSMHEWTMGNKRPVSAMQMQ